VGWREYFAVGALDVRVIKALGSRPLEQGRLQLGRAVLVHAVTQAHAGLARHTARAVLRGFPPAADGMPIHEPHISLVVDDRATIEGDRMD
jgi:hypothetical protein